MQLVRPLQQHLGSYIAALRRGWSPDSSRPATAQDQLKRIDADPAAFLASMEDRDAVGPPLKLPDGSEVARLPGLHRWMWDGEFCGSIGLRWQHGTAALPPHCLGHAGYGVVPWKQGRGLATQALGDLLPLAWAIGLPYIELTTDTDNAASVRVIVANGGLLVEAFTKPPQFGSKPGLRYRIHAPGRAEVLMS